MLYHQENCVKCFVVPWPINVITSLVFWTTSEVLGSLGEVHILLDVVFP